MNNSENNSSIPSAPPGDEFLQDLMPKLGMEPIDPKKRHYWKAWRMYLLPRLVIVALVLALAAAVYFTLRLPVRFHDVDVAENPDAAEVTFRLDRLPLLESVTAELDGAPLDVTLVEPGHYRLTVDRNGVLALTARTFTGQASFVSVTIDCIDKLPPRVDHDELVDGQVYIYLTDGEDGSGIDWSSLQPTLAASGEHFQPEEINEEQGYIRFPLPSESVRLYVADNNGNPLSLRLDPTTMEVQ